MARRCRRELALFNFSFLDILATTIGVLIFIMVLALMNATSRVSAESLAAEEERLTAEIQKHREAAAGWKEKVRQEEKTLASYATSGDPGQDIKRDIGVQEQRSRELKAENAGLAGEKSAVAQEIAELEKRVEQLQQEDAPAARSREVVEFRLPVERATTKEPIGFECAGSRVYTLARHMQLDDRNYTAISLGVAALVNRRDNAVGETFDVAMKKSSRFSQYFQGVSPNKQFVAFVVRGDSFGLFRELRATLWARGYDINWDPRENDAMLLIGAGSGGRNTVQ